MRLDVYQAKLAAEKNIKSSGLWEKLSSEEQRLIDKMVASNCLVNWLTNHSLFRFCKGNARAWDCRKMNEIP
jgi:hypothetical protein